MGERTVPIRPQVLDAAELAAQLGISRSNTVQKIGLALFQIGRRKRRSRTLGAVS